MELERWIRKIAYVMLALGGIFSIAAAIVKYFPLPLFLNATPEVQQALLLGLFIGTGIPCLVLACYLGQGLNKRLNKRV